MANKPSTVTCQEVPLQGINEKSTENSSESGGIDDDEGKSKECCSQVTVKSGEIAKSTVITSQNVRKKVIKIEIKITHD